MCLRRFFSSAFCARTESAEGDVKVWVASSTVLGNIDQMPSGKSFLGIQLDHDHLHFCHEENRI